MVYDFEFANFLNPVVLMREEEWEVLNYFRYPVLCKNAKERKELVVFMKKRGVLLWTNWSWTNIVPEWTNLKKAGYKKWSCKVSEDISSRIVFLPNHKLIDKKDISDVVNLINKFYRNVQIKNNKW
mgnify:CR=1 FL=1